MKLVKMCTQVCLIASAFSGCLSSPKSEMKKLQSANLALVSDTVSFDPARAHGLEATNVVHMLYEGLTYIDENGKIFPGIAQDIHISPDLTSFTFVLRQAHWSNGDPVKASDFEYSWKRTLNPETRSPVAYTLFPIKGAEKYFKGKLADDELGIHAMDDKTLVVNLEHPCAYFLQLTATPAFFPLSQKWVEAHPDFKEPLSNGPFQVTSFVPNQSLDLAKNAHYWGQAAVKLDKIACRFMEDKDALSTFQKGETDWVGAPFSKLGAPGRQALKASGLFGTQEAAGTQFIRVNVDHAPFSSAKFRQALLLAADVRGTIGEHQIAQGLVPPHMGLKVEEVVMAHNEQAARKAFEEALVELSITRNDLPTLHFTFVASESMQQIAQALVTNWKSALDLDVTIDALDSAAFYNRLFSQDYQLAAGSWFAEYYDPMSFLSLFAHKDNGTNNTGWENLEYTRLLEQSDREPDALKRMALLQKAQSVLMRDLPILPLFHFTFSYGKSDALQHATLSPMGSIDFEDAYMIDIPKKP